MFLNKISPFQVKHPKKQMTMWIQFSCPHPEQSNAGWQWQAFPPTGLPWTLFDSSRQKREGGWKGRLSSFLYWHRNSRKRNKQNRARGKRAIRQRTDKKARLGAKGRQQEPVKWNIAVSRVCYVQIELVSWQTTVEGPRRTGGEKIGFAVKCCIAQNIFFRYFSLIRFGIPFPFARQVPN